MAALAADAGMLAGQGEARHCAVVEADLLPPAFHMAARAILAVRALVYIIRRMAAKACGRWLCALRRLLVAGGASGKTVSALQRETRHAIMIETGLLPRRGIMAGSAIGPAAALVRVIARMTGDAGRPQTFPALPGMAGGAVRVRVGAGQREARGGVAEGLHLLPAIRRVAVLAIPAKLPAMRVGAPMAIGADARDAAIVAARAMAGGTTRPRMPAGERIIGKGVIEGGSVEPDQRIAAPLVLAVATLAGAGSRRSVLAMEMAHARDVGAHALVAGGTFGILRFLPEGGVAAVAPAFEPGMSRSQRPWRDQPFHDRLRADRRRQQQAKQPDQMQRATHSPSTYVRRRCGGLPPPPAG